MKYLILILLVSCNSPQTEKQVDTHKKNVYECKQVESIGGCSQNYCGVRFTDGTYTSGAERPAKGMTMCKWPTDQGKWDYWAYKKTVESIYGEGK